jgi:hypothetical protein
MRHFRSLSFGFVLVCGCASADRPSHDASAGSAGARQGHGFVAGGVVAKSASYKLIGTLTSGQGTASSAHYTQRAGVVGATQR